MLRGSSRFDRSAALQADGEAARGISSTDHRRRDLGPYGPNQATWHGARTAGEAGLPESRDALSDLEPGSAWLAGSRKPLAAVGNLRAWVLLAPTYWLLEGDGTEEECRILVGQVSTERRPRPRGASGVAPPRLSGADSLAM